MREAIRLFCFSLILLFAFLFGRAYSSYCKRRVDTLESLCRMLSDLEEGISVSLTTPADFFSDYREELLESSGFLSGVRSGEGMAEAFSHSGLPATLGEESTKRLSRFFTEFGGSYREGELRRIEIFRAELTEAYKEEREKLSDRIKLVYTLLVSGSRGLIILLI